MNKSIITSYNDEFNIETFECGNEDVNDYLKQKASSQEKEKITKIFIIHKNRRIIAYSAIFCSHLFFKLPDQEIEFRVPGICIGQLGVDTEFQEKGLGKILVQHAISLGNKIINYSGCRIIYVEAYDSAIEYYKNLQFDLLESRPNRNRMILDLLL